MKTKKWFLTIGIITVISFCSAMWCLAGEDGQNPVMNFVGNYVCDRARIEIMPKDDDMADITVQWGSSAFEQSQWNMSGVLDMDTLTISYDDCTQKTITYDRDTEAELQTPKETVVYKDGTGTITFGEDGTLAWNDDQEHVADGMVFEYLAVADPQQEDCPLEEYLKEAIDAGVSIDYGTSSLYTREELEDAAAMVICEFASFEGCELHTLRYAGDECNSKDNIQWMNQLNIGKKYVQVAEFLSEFHSPVTVPEISAWEQDQEYTDYQWWLAREEGGDWELLTWGY